MDVETPQAAQVFRSMVGLVHQIGTAGARELARRGRTPAQFQALWMVARHPGCTQQRLADALGVTKGNVSQLLVRLEEDGLVRREADGAAYVLRLTPAGERLTDELVPAHHAFLEQWFSGLDPAELAELERLLHRVRSCAGPG